MENIFFFTGRKFLSSLMKNPCLLVYYNHSFLYLSKQKFFKFYWQNIFYQLYWKKYFSSTEWKFQLNLLRENPFSFNWRKISFKFSTRDSFCWQRKSFPVKSLYIQLTSDYAHFNLCYDKRMGDFLPREQNSLLRQ